MLIGLPLGILLTRFKPLRGPVLGFANIMQTVPSLALFGFLIPLNIYLFQFKIVGGIGARTAIVALVLYSLLPIIRNTLTGISNVDPAIRDAGRGMGMTDQLVIGHGFKRLTLIEGAGGGIDAQLRRVAAEAEAG